MTEKMLRWGEEQQEKINRILDDLNKLKQVEEKRFEDSEIQISIINYTNKENRNGKRKYKIVKETLDTTVSLDSLIDLLTKKYEYEKYLFHNVTEIDFNKPCKWKINGSECKEQSCLGCSRTFDFTDNDKDKIVGEI